jgi:hypothetical protein
VESRRAITIDTDASYEWGGLAICALTAGFPRRFLLPLPSGRPFLENTFSCRCFFLLSVPPESKIEAGIEGDSFNAILPQGGTTSPRIFHEECFSAFLRLD